MNELTDIEPKIQRNTATVLEIETENLPALSPLFNPVDKHIDGESFAKRFIKEGASCRLDVSDCSFDYCSTENTVYFWEEPLTNLKEIYRILKRGGLLKMAFIEKKYGGDLPWTQLDFTFYQPDEVKSFLMEAGFIKIKIAQMHSKNTGVNAETMGRPFTLISAYK